MNLADTQQKSGSGSVVSNAVNARLGEHWLIPVRIVIVIVVVLALAVFFVGVLLNFAQFRTVCTPLSCADGQLTPQSAQTLQALGLSLDAYAILNVIFLVIQALVYYLLINRALVYGTLTVSIVGLYVLAVVSLGTLLQGQGNLFISLLATGLIAVLFQPLRLRLQRAINRLMYGERDMPYTVISRLGQRLEATLAPEAVLPTIVETVAQALKLPYAAITLKQQGELALEASYGLPKEGLTHLPLVYQNEQVGELLLAPRTPGEPFTPADQRLLDDLLRQAGVAVHAMRLTRELKRLTQDLQQARERLVSTREEERRRLRRDLHDGLGPQLSSQTLLLTSAQMLLRRDPDETEAILKSAVTQAQEAISDIRRLVYALRPPALDDLGLVAAIQEQINQNRASGVAFSFEAPEHLPPLPAAVEVACYRIAQEGLTNVVRHAHAHSCTVHLTSGEQLIIEIIDDGQGLPPAYRCGVGLTSMRERAEELGGSWLVEAGVHGGTRVQAQLPYR
jgi:signal transduction histidine kinase